MSYSVSFSRGGPAVGAALGPMNNAEPIETVRTFFPETWIWDLVETGWVSVVEEPIDHLHGNLSFATFVVNVSIIFVASLYKGKQQKSNIIPSIAKTSSHSHFSKLNLSI